MDRELGDYSLERVLGRGASGVVHLARHKPTGTLRALKVVSFAFDFERLARIRREAETLARAGGDGVLPVHEVHVARGSAVLALAYMPNGSLRARLEAKRRLGWRDAALLALALARALARCHAAGVIHRDLKPDNVLFDEQDRPRIADFGLARDLDADSLTKTGAVLGTPAYMAPEQLDGSKVDARADLYALGTILHECLAGALPFEADAPLELFRRKAQGAPPPLPATVPADLARLVAWLLAPAPDDRPADALAVAADLEAILAGAPSRAATAGPRARRARSGLAALAGLALLAGATFAVDRFLTPGGSPPPGGVATTAHSKPPPSARAELDAARRHLDDALRVLRSQRPVALAGDHIAAARAACAGEPLPADAVATIRSELAARIQRACESGRTTISKAAARRTVNEVADAHDLADSLGVALPPNELVANTVLYYLPDIALIGDSAVDDVPTALRAILLMLDADPKRAPLYATQQLRNIIFFAKHVAEAPLERITAALERTSHAHALSVAVLRARMAGDVAGVLRAGAALARESRDPWLRDHLVYDLVAQVPDTPAVRSARDALDAFVSATADDTDARLVASALDARLASTTLAAIDALGRPDRVRHAIAASAWTMGSCAKRLLDAGRNEDAARWLAASLEPKLANLAASARAAKTPAQRQHLIERLDHAAAEAMGSH